MKRLTLSAMLLALLCTTASAQTDPEYRAEIGVGAGLVSYQGDFNSSLLKNMQPLYGAVAKYRFNPRTALSLNIISGKIKGDSRHTTTWYEQTADSTVSFSNTLVDAGIKLEYNFWPYGTGREYRGAKPLVPYLTLGLGATYVKPQEGSIVAVNVPIGVGVKYKVATRLNLTLEWLMHFCGSDKLDGVKDPYGIKSSGLFKNTDCYSTLQLSLTYDIMAKCRTCHNENE